VRDEVLGAFPDLPAVAAMVWVPMLKEDDAAAARLVAELIADPRLQHFYDARRAAGRAIAGSLGGRGHTAWDAYLFYRPGARWRRLPPPPDAWVHQLGGSAWADPARLRRGAEMRAELRRLAVTLISRA